MRQIPSLDGPLNASRRLLGLVWRQQGCRATLLRGSNLHRTTPDSPAASSNLLLSEILQEP
jgi:hypothetical protein